MARARREVPEDPEEVRNVDAATRERLSDNPFLPPVTADGVLQFPPDWSEEQKDAYVLRMREAGRLLRQKEREEGVPFTGEVVTMRRR